MTAPTAAQVIEKFRTAIDAEIETLDRLLTKTNASLNVYTLPSYFDQKETIEAYTRLRVLRTVEYIIDKPDISDDEKVAEVSTISHSMLETSYVKRDDLFRKAVWEFEKRVLNQILEIIRTGE